MPADDSALKYRALLQISEALIACRDRDALTRSLWEALNPLIPFDYLVIMQYDAARRCVMLKSIAGRSQLDEAKREEWPVQASPVHVLLGTPEPLDVPYIARDMRAL